MITSAQGGRGMLIARSKDERQHGDGGGEGGDSLNLV